MSDLTTHLASLFGFHAFRPHQEPVIRSVLAGRDSFTVMPTGGGKSLCYQLPARLLSGVCVVVSPLISLMKDQVDAARANGLAAATLNSACSARERNAALAGLNDGSLDLLYVSPERMRLPGFLDYLKTRRIAFFAIDEAHCISEWGHDFRPDYLALSSLSADFPGVPLAAFTATATPQVAQDIIDRLCLRDPFCTRASFNRPNLFYQVTPKTDAESQLLDFVRRYEGESGIIYRTTRKDVEATAAFLNKHGVKALTYHAGLTDAERGAAQDAFREDVCPLIVATIAFGMGIDKSNVRFVAHGDLPKNLEAYYQETGRAGRDGEPARCALFYGRKDIVQLLRFADGIDDETAREAARNQVYRMLDFTQKEGCRRKALLAHFGEELPGDSCGACDICTGEAEREDAGIAAQKLLSAVVRTGSRFGANHVIAVVMGKENKLIRECGHHELPTFGVGADRDGAYWRHVMDALLAQGLARVSNPLRPIPAVTPSGWEVLRGQRSCSVIRLAESKARQRRGRMSATESPLFSLLRQERTRLAKEEGVPPYVILSDRSLREICERLPESNRELLDITGIGQHKLAAYGNDVLALVQAWLKEHPEEAERKSRSSPPPDDLTANLSGVSSEDDVRGRQPGGSTGKRIRGDSLRETARLLDSGLGLAETAAERGLALSTIVSHLERLANGGTHYSPYRFLEPERFERIRMLFAQSGGWTLTPVVERSKEAGAAGEDASTTGIAGTPVSYEEARLARIFLRPCATPDEIE